MKSVLTGLLFVVCGSAFAQGPMTVGGTLFNDKASDGLIRRRTASKKGDVLTIRVNEVMQGQYSANTTATKTVAATANKISLPILDVFAGPVLGNILGSQAGLPQKIVNGLLGGGTVGGNESSTGGGTATTNNRFSTSLSVTVVDVEPNGNLRIEGVRYVQVNKEVQKMTLTGIVRPDDVLPDNTVPSDRVANADIKADGKGAVAEKTRRGFLGRILDWLL